MLWCASDTCQCQAPCQGWHNPNVPPELTAGPCSACMWPPAMALWCCRKHFLSTSSYLALCTHVECVFVQVPSAAKFASSWIVRGRMCRADPCAYWQHTMLLMIVSCWCAVPLLGLVLEWVNQRAAAAVRLCAAATPSGAGHIFQECVVSVQCLQSDDVYIVAHPRGRQV